MLKELPGRSLFRSLVHRPFALLWSGQTISRLGDSLYGIALAWWVLEKTGSATVMGTVLVFSLVPSLIFMLVGGLVVDRLPRLRVMLVSDILSGLVVTAVALLALSNRLEVWHVYVASTVFGLVAAFFQPAYTAAVPEVTPDEDLPSANSLTSLSWQIAGITGPAIGATIVALGGTPMAFALDGLSFFLSAACLVPLFKHCSPSTRQAMKGTSTSGALQDLQEGIETVLGAPWLWLTIAIASLGNIMLSGPVHIALPFLVKENLQGDVGLLGFLSSLASFGSVAAALWFGRLARIRRRGPTAYGALISGGLMLVVAGLAALVVGLPLAVVTIMLTALAFGASMTAFSQIWMNTLQEMVPRDRLGRVASIDFLGSFALLPVGYGLVGWATDQIGAPLVFAIGGALSVSLSLLALLHPAIRDLD